jgi:ATP-binding cassette subfamily B protein
MATNKVDWRFNMSVFLGFLRRHWILAAGAVFFLVLLEIAAIVQNYLFKMVVDDGTAFMGGTLSRALLVDRLWFVALVFCGVILTFAGGRWMFMHLVNRLESLMQRDLKEMFFEHILRLSHSFHASHRTGALISRLLRGASALEAMTDTFLFSMIPILIQTVAAGTVIFQFDHLTSLVVILTAVSITPRTPRRLS